MTYRCTVCGQGHDDLPAFGLDRPDQFWDVPEDKRDCDVFLTADSCVIADRFFFIRGCVEIPITDADGSFSLGVWVSLNEDSFFAWQESFDLDPRDHIGPFFGWFCSRIPIYPDTMHLKTHVHLRNKKLRPLVELEHTDHPMALDQRNGISMQTAWQYAHALLGDSDNFAQRIRIDCARNEPRSYPVVGQARPHYR
jgi:hypothetical protein